MKILEQVEVQLQWSDLESMHVHEYVKGNRSVGVHQSDVLRYVAIKMKMYSAEDQADDMPLRVMLGMGFEEQAVRLYPKIQWQPGEMVIDRDSELPVYVSPDGIEGEWGRSEWLVHEFKLTGYSMSKEVKSLWLYHQQIMAGINAMRQGELESNKGVLHVCWKYGDYKRPFTERYLRYLVEYDEQELAGNLMLLRNHREQVAREKGIVR